jgi:hypothetical protein
MKTLLEKSLKTWLIPAILLLAVIASVTVSGRTSRRGASYSLGGTFAGNVPGMVGDLAWINTDFPDPSGQTSRSIGEWMANGDFELAALAPVGATRVSYYAGNSYMTGKDTFHTELRWYLIGPSGDEPYLDEIKAIAEASQDCRFIDHDTISSVTDLRIYETNGDLSMTPTENMTLYLEMSGINAISKRVL